jgi:uncharacterized membrane protein YhhN
MFATGLLAFMTAHGLYLSAFYTICARSQSLPLASLLAGIAGIAVYRYLQPSLGSYKLPIAIYIVLISAMLLGAVAVYNTDALPAGGRRLVLAGAVLFYLSDLAAARNRFLRPAFINRLVGLPLYYGGQFMLALSIGLMAP